ncbi:rod shape-determining protein [Feifania hominis]|uniref:Cell shape-determining protein MreB n=1 Tax=Feifania hominis TaxID=2763660 RepID=A0A926DDS8_9FIRM|nr:rod shape-determining protein MreB [Feifania hominis]MBC8535469.1 rod shape-determining protein MreB [Feifania hominis]
MYKEIGMDLGTSSVLVFIKNKGIVLREPSVVAIDRLSNKVLAVGTEAQKMLGRTPGNIVAIRPLRDGVISDYEMTEKMIKYFLKKVLGFSLFKPRVMICVPSGITEVEERAVIDAAIQSGAKKAYLVEEPVAAAIGAGIDINRANGSMVIDVGGGTTDIAVISLGGVVVSESIKIAGDKFDEAIIKFCRRKHNVLIGERSAEKIKMEIGCLFPMEEKMSVDVKGRCMLTGFPKIVTITSDEILEALEECASSILEAVHAVLERTPPELAGDIVANGIIMTGGGSLIHGFDKLIQFKTGIKTVVADDAISCVAKGTGECLSMLANIPDGTLNLARNREMQY